MSRNFDINRKLFASHMLIMQKLVETKKQETCQVCQGAGQGDVKHGQGAQRACLRIGSKWYSTTQPGIGSWDRFEK